jgi:vacuolar-type H+-ATPase subunit E/Vma4
MDLLDQISQEGQREADRIVSEADAQARERIARADEEIAAQTEAYREGERNRIEQERRLIISRARAQARAKFLKAKGQVADVLFQRLQQETANLRSDTEAYRAFLSRCLREAEREIPGSLVLQIDPRDTQVVTDLLQGSSSRIGDNIRTLGGFIATNADGDLVFDDRLETRIENLRQKYRPELGKALFDRASSG